MGGTAIGALGGSLIGDPEALGLDAMFPAFYLALLVGEMDLRTTGPSALLGAAIALCLVPFAPPGIPVVAASRPRCWGCASDDDVWVTIALLTIGTVAIKAAGPVALGGRDLPPRLNGVVARLAPALLAALVVVETFGRDKALGIDESAARAARRRGRARRAAADRGRRIAAAVTAGLRVGRIGRSAVPAGAGRRRRVPSKF